MEAPIQRVLSYTFHETQPQFSAVVYDDGAVATAETFLNVDPKLCIRTCEIFNRSGSLPAELRFEAVQLSFSREPSDGPKYLAGILNDGRLVVWDVRVHNENSNINEQRILLQDLGVVTGTAWGYVDGISTLAISVIDLADEVETIKLLKIDFEAEARFTVARFSDGPIRHNTPERLKLMKFVPGQNTLVSCTDQEMIVWKLPEENGDTPRQLGETVSFVTSNDRCKYVAVGVVAGDSGANLIEITVNSDDTVQDGTRVRIVELASYRTQAESQDSRFATIIPSPLRWCVVGIAPTVFGKTIRLAGADHDGNIEVYSGAFESLTASNKMKIQVPSVRDLVWSPFVSSSHCCVVVPREAYGLVLLSIEELPGGNTWLHNQLFASNIKAKSVHWTNELMHGVQGILVEGEGDESSLFVVVTKNEGSGVDVYAYIPSKIEYSVEER